MEQSSSQDMVDMTRFCKSPIVRWLCEYLSRDSFYEATSRYFDKMLVSRLVCYLAIIFACMVCIFTCKYIRFKTTKKFWACWTNNTYKIWGLFLKQDIFLVPKPWQNTTNNCIEILKASNEPNVPISLFHNDLCPRVFRTLSPFSKKIIYITCVSLI